MIFAIEVVTIARRTARRREPGTRKLGSLRSMPVFGVEGATAEVLLQPTSYGPQL
jgi:hypothetical protein